MTYRRTGNLFVPTRNIWVPKRSLRDCRGSISPALIGCIAAARTAGGSQIPTDITNCVLWLRADGTDKVYKSGTSTQATDGEFVGTWVDESGGGQNATNSTADKYPTFQTNEINTSLPVIRFDSTNDQLLNTGFTALDGVSGGTVLTVFKQSSTGAQFGSAFIRSVDNFGFQTDKNGTTYLRVSESNYGSYSASTRDAYTIMVLRFDGAGSGNAGRLQGYELGAAKTLSFNGTIPSTLPNVTGYQLSYLTSTYYLSGDIAEVIVYSKALSQAERWSMEGYLATKYGLSVSQS